MPGGEQQPPPSGAFDLLDLGPGRNTAVFRLTLAFMILVLLTFISVEGWRAWRDYNHAYDFARDSVTNLVRATAQHAEDAIRQVDILTYTLGERVEGDGLATINAPRIHALMVQQSKLMPQLHGLFIYGADGRWIVTDKDVPPDTPNNADRDYFIYHRDHKDPRVRISNVVKSRSTGELIIPVSRRLNNPDGSFAGVILGTIKLSYFMDYYGDFKIDDRGALVLTMRDGTILVRRPFMDSVVGQSLADSEIFKRYLLTANQGIAEIKAVVDGTYRLYAFRALSSYPLVVQAGLERILCRAVASRSAQIRTCAAGAGRRLYWICLHRAHPVARSHGHGERNSPCPSGRQRHGPDGQPDATGQPAPPRHGA